MNSKMCHGSRIIVKLNRQKKRVSFEQNLYFGQKQGARSRERDDIEENACDVKRSEPVPRERWRHMSGFLPRAPRADAGGRRVVVDIYIYVYIWEDLII